MKKSTIILLIICASSLLSFEYIMIKDYLNFLCIESTYFGQKAPGKAPIIFCPNRISIRGYQEYGIHFSSDGREFFFTRSDHKNNAVLMHSKHTTYGWLLPDSLSIMKQNPRSKFCLSPDGNKLLFVPIKNKHDTLQVYSSERKPSGWSQPILLTNTDLGSSIISICLSNSGNLYFTGDYDESGKKDIYFSECINGKYLPPRNMGESVNSIYSENNVFIAPDESYLIFDSQRNNTDGESDLYISFRKPDGNWTKAENLGETINSEFSEWLPYVTPDGKYLFFSRTVQEETDIYWVSADVIMRHKARYHSQAG